MKKYDKMIVVHVSIDTIATKLHEILGDFKHKEILIDSIIAPKIEKDQLEEIGFIYNSLNGFDHVVDFKVGDKVKLQHKQTIHIQNRHTAEEDLTFEVREVFPYTAQVRVSIEDKPEFISSRHNMSYFQRSAE